MTLLHFQGIDQRLLVCTLVLVFCGLLGTPHPHASAQDDLSLQRLSYGAGAIKVLMPTDWESRQEKLSSPIGEVPAQFWAGSYSSSLSGGHSIIRFGEVLEEGYTLNSLSSTVKRQFLDNIVENISTDFPEDAYKIERIEQQGYEGRQVTLEEKNQGLIICLLFLDEVAVLSFVAYEDGAETSARRVLESLHVAEDRGEGTRDELERRRFSFQQTTVSVEVGDKVKKETADSGVDWTFSTERSVQVVIANDFGRDASTLSHDRVQEMLDQSIKKVASAKGAKRVKDTPGTWEGHPTRVVVLAEVPNVGSGILAIRALVVKDTLWLFFWSPRGPIPNLDVFGEKYHPLMREYLDSVQVH